MRGLLAACISFIRFKALLPVATDREPYHNSLATLVGTSIETNSNVHGKTMNATMNDFLPENEYFDGESFLDIPLDDR